jgi:hypothetical protein
MFSVPLFILSQECADGVKKVGLMIEQGECEDATEASEEPCGGDSEIKEVVKIVPALIQLCLESPQTDTFSHSWRSIEYGDASGFQPEV